MVTSSSDSKYISQMQIKTQITPQYSQVTPISINTLPLNFTNGCSGTILKQTSGEEKH